MRKLKTNNINAEVVTLQQACEKYNLGANTIRRLAKECGAEIKIGKSYRIRTDRLSRHIYSFEA